MARADRIVEVEAGERALAGVPGQALGDNDCEGERLD